MYVIGVDSDQSHLAPEVVLTSMVKHVDLAVYEAARDLAGNDFKGGVAALRQLRLALAIGQAFATGAGAPLAGFAPPEMPAYA